MEVKLVIPTDVCVDEGEEAEMLNVCELVDGSQSSSKLVKLLVESACP